MFACKLCKQSTTQVAQAEEGDWWTQGQYIARLRDRKILEYCEDRLFFHQEGKELKL